MKRIFILPILLLTAQAPAHEHWAEVDRNGVVLRVIVADQEFINSGAVGNPARWVRTYKTRTQRHNYAAPGFTYDKSRDAFIPPKPFPSWVLDEGRLVYDAPKSYPRDGRVYKWNEDTLEWVESK